MRRDAETITGPGLKSRFEAETLYVRTGLMDDPRQPLSVGQTGYALAEHAFENQDEWCLQEHALFWGPMLTLWPVPRGRRPVIDALSAAAAHLRAHGIESEDEIQRALNVAPGVLRPASSDSRRERANFEHGAALMAGAPAQGITLRRLALGKDPDGAAPLPRVYSDPDREPAFTFVNPHLSPMLAPQSAGAHHLDASECYLRKLWEQGDPRVRTPSR